MQLEPHLSPVTTEQVLLLVDWDNFFYGLLERFGVGKMDIERRIKSLVRWTKGIGGLFGGHGFVFAPEHLSILHQEICTRHDFLLITCPKRRLREPRRNPKTWQLENSIDTVDETIIAFAKMMIGHPNFKTVCLVSGDNDYVPLFEEMGSRGIRRALAPPSAGCLAKTGGLVDLVDKNPVNHRRMILMLDKV